ncbi:hypothetical protein DY023_01880 [Microbacterium bovistercoris]|uniref:Nucleotidyl transferase AbiEii/AbiGii toxin family protein n=1 Tax=Microbacterium bovistercoris TaxID=2293570 RepID=A0A371NXY2_9MICO|nr:hypothetical protein DY023_01880 [Microbacterium bovistercoris]
MLDYLGEELDPSILIGGWATHLRVGGEISYDIDFIVTTDSRHRIPQVLPDATDNTVHQGRKFTGELEGVHLDIYVPHESQLGMHLRLKVEVLAKYVDDKIAPPWLLLTIEAHAVTKLAALLDRPHSEKGAKDARELLALLKKGVDAEVALRILAEATAGSVADIPQYVVEMFRLIHDLAKPSKDDQKTLAALRRAWVQESLVYGQQAGPATRSL